MLSWLSSWSPYHLSPLIIVVTPVHCQPLAQAAVGWGAQVILGIGPSLGRHCPLTPLALSLIHAIVVLVCPILPSSLSLSLSLSLSSPFLTFWPSLSAPCLFFLLLVRSSLLLSPSLFHCGPCPCLWSWLCRHHPPTPGSLSGIRNPPCEQRLAAVCGGCCVGFVVLSSSSAFLVST
jgi:hypothetical protein